MNDKHRAGIWSSWIIEHGWARRPGQPKPKIPPYEPSTIASVRRPDIPRIPGRQSTMALAKLEIARRIAAKGKR